MEVLPPIFGLARRCRLRRTRRVVAAAPQANARNSLAAQQLYFWACARPLFGRTPRELSTIRIRFLRRNRGSGFIRANVIRENGVDAPIRVKRLPTCLNGELAQDLRCYLGVDTESSGYLL